MRAILAYPRAFGLALAIVTQLTAVSASRAADSAQQEGAPAAAVQVVPTKHVCMVNNAYMQKDQIPVDVEGRTYFGCCEMCKERLAKDAAMRVAVDPVSGKEVDKATAVIGALPNGNVVYFESQANLESYNAKVRG